MIIEELLTGAKMMAKEAKYLGRRVYIGGSRTKSIASLSNDSTYFFPVVGSEYLSSDELVMLCRAFERSYAMFTRTCFSLIPAVEVPKFDEATVRDYLQKFHTNIGTSPNVSRVVIDTGGPSFVDRISKSSLNEASTQATGGISWTKDDNFRVNGTFKAASGSAGDAKDEANPYKKATTLFSDLDWKKANDMLPTTMQVPVKFVDGNGNFTTVEIMVNIKATMHKAGSGELIRDIANSVQGKSGFLRFVQYISGEQKSLSDFLFGISQMKSDLLNKKSNPWIEAFKRRKRLSDAALGTMADNYKPIATLCLTMNEVNMLKTKYNLDVFKEAASIMKTYYLLGFAIVDQVNEVVHVMYDSQPGFQDYPYKTLERESANQDRTLKDMVKAMGALR